MSKKAVAQINKQIEKNKKSLGFAESYLKTLRAIKDLTSMADDCAKRGLPHEVALEHLETLTAIYRDASALFSEGTENVNLIKSDIKSLTVQKEDLEKEYELAKSK